MCTGVAQINKISYFTEEKILHEEVDLKWDDVQSIVKDFRLLEELRSFLVVGVSVVEQDNNVKVIVVIGIWPSNWIKI